VLKSFVLKRNWKRGCRGKAPSRRKTMGVWRQSP